MVALLGCGWPNHKDYKWEDTKELMEYALENYEYQQVYEEVDLPDIEVIDGVQPSVAIAVQGEPFRILLGKKEKTEKIVDYQKTVEAPVKQGDEVGDISYYLGEELIVTYPIVTMETVNQKTLTWYFSEIVEQYMCIEKKMA